MTQFLQPGHGQAHPLIIVRLHRGHKRMVGGRKVKKHRRCAAYLKDGRPTVLQVQPQYKGADIELYEFAFSLGKYSDADKKYEGKDLSKWILKEKK